MEVVHSRCVLTWLQYHDDGGLLPFQGEVSESETSNRSTPVLELKHSLFWKMIEGNV